MSEIMKVQFFDYSRVYSTEAERYDNVLKDVLYRSDFIMRDDLAKFEKKLASFVGVKHAIGVANGTDAIWLSLLAVGIKPTDEIIIPSHTYVATAGAVKMIGAIPILADCGEDHLINPESVESLITERTKAIIPVQLNGRTAVMEPLFELSQKYNLILVEDEAQGLGSKYKGKMAGSFGIAGTYSFFPAKVLGCFGDGGAVVTDDDNVAIKVRRMRDHGRDVQGKIRMWGYNSRLDNIQAAILLEKFRTFERDINHRRKIASIYSEHFKDIKEIISPPSPNDEGSKHYNTFQNYEIEVESRDNLRSYLAEHNIDTIIQWGGKPLHGLTALGLHGKDLSRTELLFKRAVLLPMNQYMYLNEAEYVAQKVREFYGAK